MGMIMNYVGFADRTARPVHSKAKARSKPDWAWHPYREYGSMNPMNGRIKVFRPDSAGVFRQIGSVAPGRAKREAKG